MKVSCIYEYMIRNMKFANAINAKDPNNRTNSYTRMRQSER